MKFFGSISGALELAIKAFVFAGLPTTKIFTFLLALLFMANPWWVKIFAFASRRSLLSIPGPRGIAPTKNPKSH